MVLNDTNFKRDLRTGALVNTSTTELQRFLRERKNVMKAKELYNEMESVKSELENLKKLLLMKVAA